jgi:GNAT superfamily N-acetyltransferase
VGSNDHAGLVVEELTVAEVDRVARLFMELVEFHGEVVEGAWPVRSGADAWALRRGQYLEWLGEGSARMLVAVPAEDAADPLGYAVLTIKPSMPSWDVGARVGELETLAVAAAPRGQGVGSLLIEACGNASAPRGSATGRSAWSRRTRGRRGSTNAPASGRSTGT